MYNAIIKQIKAVQVKYFMTIWKRHPHFFLYNSLAYIAFQSFSLTHVTKKIDLLFEQNENVTQK